MANQQAVITAEPVRVPEDQILFPLVPKPETPEIPWVPIYETAEKKGIIFNIETNGFDPLSNRVISIGLQDPLFPEYNPTVIIIDDEEQIISAFFEVLKSGGYNELIGYGLGFDYRFILIKAMYYGLTCKEFYDCEIYDLMQAGAQGKFSFVYSPQKALDLSDLANYLWDYPKPFSDVEMIKYYVAGDYTKVIEFTSGQITRILALYLTFRNITENPITSFSSGVESMSVSSNETLSQSSNSLLTIPEVSSSNVLEWKCGQCMAEWSDLQLGGSRTCPICGNGLVMI
jgi:hypothetical protein